MESWTARTGVVTLRFGDIVLDSNLVIENISDHLGLDAHLQDPILPPRLHSKWRGRMHRIFATNAPSTEIMTPNQGKTFDAIFSEVDLRRYEEIV